MSGNTGAPLNLELLEPSQSEPEVLVNAAFEAINSFAAGVNPESDHSDSVGGSISVSDGLHTVDPCTSLIFEAGLVTDEGGGVARYTPPGGSGSDTGGGGNVTPDTHPFTPDPMDDEFEGNSLDPKWSWGNQGATTFSIGQGAGSLFPPVNDSDIHSIEQPLPVGSTWRFRAKFSVLNFANFNHVGLMLRESGTGKIVLFGFVSSSSTADWQITDFSGYAAADFVHTELNGSTGMSDGGYVNGGSGLGLDFDPVYYEIEKTGSNYILRISRRGYDAHFEQVYSASITTYFTTAADVIGLFAIAQNMTQRPVISVDWFRRMA